MNTTVTFLATTTNRDRLPSGAFRVQVRRVDVLALPGDSDDDASLLALQLVACRVPDGMVLDLQFADAVV